MVAGRTICCYLAAEEPHVTMSFGSDLATILKAVGILIKWYLTAVFCVLLLVLASTC